MPRPATYARKQSARAEAEMQRLRQLGGRLEIDSNSEGTTITAVLPIANGADHGAST